MSGNATLNCLGWMQNQVGQSPCTTAQEVGQLCKQGYTVSLNTFQENDYVPDAATANSCTCSWSIYNLLSACTFCLEKYQYPSWSTWTSQCGSHASNTTYFPSKHSLSQGIPYWAATNPSTWTNATFNVTEAADIAATPHQDVTGGPLPNSTTSNATDSPSSRVPIGAITGGIAGGVAIIIIGGLIIFCAMRRRRRQGIRAKSVGGPFFDTSRPVTPAPPFSNWNSTTAMPLPPEHAYGGTTSPYLAPSRPSTTNLAPNSPLASPITPGCYSNEYDPFADMTGMNSPFFVTPPAQKITRISAVPPPSPRVVEPLPERQMTFPETRSRLNSPLSPRTMEPLAEREMSFPEARSRLNPPPYAAVVPEESIPLTRMPSMEKREKWNDSVTAEDAEQTDVSIAGHTTTVFSSPGQTRSLSLGVRNR